MNHKKEFELNDARDFALKACMFITSRAREVGEENKPYVQNAVKTISAFSYNRSVVREAVNNVMLRLERKRAAQLMSGNPFMPPNQGILKGSIYVGQVVGSNATVALSLRQLNENIGIWGRAGSGKTNLSYNVCIQLDKIGIPVRVYDYKDEYRDLLPFISNMLVLNPKNDKFNPFEPIEDPKAWLQFLADTLQQDFNLRPETKFMLLNYFDELYRIYGVYENSRTYPSIHNMREFLMEKVSSSETSASNRRKIYTCLEVLNSLITSISDMLDCSSGYTEETLSGFSLVSYEMSNLSSNIQSWLTKLRLKHLYHRCFSDNTRHRLKMVGLFEEAKMLLSGDLHKGSTSIDYIKQLITQARASGFGAMITDQNKNELADFVMNNLSCQICFNLASPKEIRATGSSMGCTEEQIKQIRNLKIPNAIVSMAGHPPFMVSIPKSPVTRHISDNELARIMQLRLANIAFTSGQRPQRKKVRIIERREIVKQERTLNDFQKELMDFLQQVKNTPELNVNILYSSLNLSGRRGNKIKRQLLANGLIEEKEVFSGERGRPSIRLTLTEKGYRELKWLQEKVKAD